MPATTTTRKRVRRAGAAPDELNRHLTAAADLQRQIQQLELALQEHRTWLLTHLQTTGDKSVTLGTFTASLRSRANWTYSARLTNEMLRLKQEQQHEQQDGKAINSPTPYVALTFKVAR
jgi:hypothetical protein